MKPYAGKKQYRCLKEYAGLQDDGGETQIRLYEDLLEDDRCHVTVEVLDDKGRSWKGDSYSGTLGQMEAEYEKQIWAWRKSETTKAVKKAREAGAYDGLEQ